MNNSILVDIDQRGVATVTLNRPDKGNALNTDMIIALTQQLESLNNNSQVRVVILTGSGKHFCTGADLNDMQSMINYNEKENFADALQLATLMQTLHELNKPTIANIHGASYGGALGLIACCDLAIASDDARFCFSEVKLGLIPAVISPYVVAAIGERHARRYFLTAEVFDAQTARDIGLIHQGDLEPLTDTLLQNGPQALANTKQLLTEIRNQPFSKALTQTTAQAITKQRVSDEAQQRMQAFLTDHSK